jgi:protein-S-isoprenylcysteine O-methyltransferase Ste14
VPPYAYIILAAGWILWFTPFLLNKWNFKTPEKKDNRARWGIVLEAVAYTLVWQSDFWTRAPGIWRMTLSILFLLLAALLSWTGVRALGRHLRFDAALAADHQLVRSGPYRVVRHPIYTSMLCTLLGTGFIVAPWPLLLAALMVFLIGTEIRVRIEDNLLGSHFGGEFKEYRRTVSAYIPLVR